MDIDLKELHARVAHDIAGGCKAINMDLPVMLYLLDRLERAEAEVRIMEPAIKKLASRSFSTAMDARDKLAGLRAASKKED